MTAGVQPESNPLGALRAEQRRMAVVALAACTWVLGTALVGMTDAVAYLAPALLLFALVATGRYPGERTYARRISKRRRGRPRRTVRLGRRRCPLALMPRGGVLLAAGLAGRGPPPAAL